MKNGYRLLFMLLWVCALLMVQGCGGLQRTSGNPPFVLEWEDHFDEFDPSRWQIGTHTWTSNLVQFVPENVTFQDGTMRLHLKKEKTENRDFTGAEYRTIEKLLYGRYVVRARFIKGSGLVSSFFTYRDPAVPNWQEIDVEVLGKDTSHVQFTYHWGNPPVSDQRPETFELDFATDSDFHEYAFEWIPGKITWYLDGQKMYTALDENVPHLPQQIMMNVWISEMSSWAGEFDESAVPAYAEYDYVKYYRLDPTGEGGN